jgi:hypothetical protein
MDAKHRNAYDKGIVDMGGESINITARETIHTDTQSGATVNHLTVDVDRGISWAKVGDM